MSGSGGLGHALGAFAVGLQSDDLPASVRNKLKLHIIDALGCAVAAHSLPFASAVIRLARVQGGKRQSSIWGTAWQLPAAQAALVNGSLVSAMALDDTHSEAVVHPACSIIPCVLALAEHRNSSGPEVLAALAVGYETMIRLGLAAPNRFHEHGLHATSLCGAVGAAAAAANMLRLSPHDATSALGIAASLAGGLLEPVDTGAPGASLQFGWAAHIGVTAGLGAMYGVAGAETALDGRHGLFRAHLGDRAASMSRVLKGLNRSWELESTAFTEYATGRYAHPFIEAALRLREGGQIRAADVDSVVCRVPEGALRLVAEPRQPKLRPPNIRAARFSLYYCVAATLLWGWTPSDIFSDQGIANRDVLQLAQKVVYEVMQVSPSQDRFCGEVILHLRNGQEKRYKVDAARGSTSNPMSQQDIVEKFHGNATAVLGAPKADRLVEAISQLEIVRDIRQIAVLWQPDPTDSSSSLGGQPDIP